MVATPIGFDKRTAGCPLPGALACRAKTRCADLDRAISLLKDAGIGRLLISAHDSCDHAIARLLSESTTRVEVLAAGSTLRLWPAATRLAQRPVARTSPSRIGRTGSMSATRRSRITSSG